MWQQRILKYAAGSKDKVIRNIMGEMEAALGDKECDREGKYNFFHQLLQDNIQDFEENYCALIPSGQLQLQFSTN